MYMDRAIAYLISNDRTLNAYLERDRFVQEYQETVAIFPLPLIFSLHYRLLFPNQTSNHFITHLLVVRPLHNDPISDARVFSSSFS